MVEVEERKSTDEGRRRGVGRITRRTARMKEEEEEGERSRRVEVQTSNRRDENKEALADDK
eukprot:509915-Hanusia_phi.AAC.1